MQKAMLGESNLPIIAFSLHYSDHFPIQKETGPLRREGNFLFIVNKVRVDVQVHVKSDPGICGAGRGDQVRERWGEIRGGPAEEDPSRPRGSPA